MSKTTAPTPQSPFWSVFQGEKPSHRPVWFMRQAGRSLPEYREIRAKMGMLESCFHPDMVTEITLQPVRRHNVDAAIFFSDIIVPLKAACFPIDIKPGVGPVTDTPISSSRDIEKFPRVTPEQLEPITQAASQLIHELGSTPLIGFAGAPFTLSSYLIEGGPSKTHAKAKAFMYSNESLWHSLLDKIADMTIEFLRAQIRAGVRVIQLFDSWAGTLSRHDYLRYVAPHSYKVLHTVNTCKRIHFGIGTGDFVADMALADIEGIGLDWRMSFTEAIETIGRPVVLQGNLDPAYLFTSTSCLHEKVASICAQADQAIVQGARGHIFNLGHGVPAEADPGVISAVVEMVHSL